VIEFGKGGSGIVHKDVAQPVDTLLLGEAPTPSLAAAAVARNNTSDEDVKSDDSPVGNEGRHHSFEMVLLTSFA
jgi:hypothetical protein